jgi:hypothetical protein
MYNVHILQGCTGSKSPRENLKALPNLNFVLKHPSRRREGAQRGAGTGQYRPSGEEGGWGGIVSRPFVGRKGLKEGEGWGRRKEGRGVI